MEQSFNIAVAKKLDINAAIFLQQLAGWIRISQATKKLQKDGHYWARFSSKMYSLMQYWIVTGKQPY